MSNLTTIKVPDIGDVTDAEIIEISINTGDVVDVEDTLIVLETDKATMDIPSPLMGKISQINVAVGDKVSCGDPIASVEMVEGASDDKEVSQPAEPAEKEPAESVNKESAAVEEPAADEKPAVAEGLVYASPAVRRFAREIGADISSIQGSGAKGRVIKADVQQFVKTKLSNIPSQGTGSGTGLIEMPVVDFSKYGETESLPLSRIQKVSSKNLHRNWVSIPDVEAALKGVHKKAQYYETHPISPAKMDKLDIPVKLRNKLDDLVIKKSSGVTIAAQDDKRPAVSAEVPEALKNLVDNK